MASPPKNVGTEIRLKGHGIFVLIILSMGLLYTSAIHSVPPVIPGDLSPRGDTNGIVDSGDLLILQQIVLGSITPTADELLAGDVAPLGNPDGQINAGDLVVLTRAILGTVILPDPDDTTPPAPVDPGLITIGDPVNGIVQVTGQAGSAEGNTSIKLTNFETGAVTLNQSNADGGFSASFAAESGHVFSAVVTDGAGNQSSSVSLGVGQILDLTITSPFDGITINGDLIRVTGTYGGPPGTAIIVNGRAACTDGVNFYAGNIPLDPGSNTLRVSAIMPDGLTVMRTSMVNSMGVTHVYVQADSACGFAPHTVDFTLVNDSANSIQQIDADYDGDGTIDFSTNSSSQVLEYTYTAPGVYEAAFTLLDQLGMQYTNSQVIVVSSLTSADTQLRNVYEKMRDRLRVGAIDGALNYLTPVMQDIFRPVFQSLGSGLADVIDQLGGIAGGSIGDDLALYTVVRDENGVPMGYPVYMVRGNDGIWRIGQM